MTNYRVKVEYDEIGQSNQDSPTGGPLPESAEEYAKSPVSRLVDPQKGAAGGWREISYEEYCQHEGNPDKHVVLRAYVERQCSQCGAWERTDASLSGIDFMEDDPDVGRMGTYSPEDVARLPKMSYLREVMRDLLDEVQAPVA